MTTATRIVLLVVVLLVVAAVAAALLARSRARQRAALQSTFGPEYDRTVASTGRRRDAERELAERAERRRALDIRPLPAADRTAYAERWRSTQADFVDRPSDAVRTADHLVTEVMARRGYPVEDFEQQVRDVSVDHAEVVEQYRAAHAVSELNDRSQASTEQLRQAMVHYRALFDDLLADHDGDSAPGDAAVAGSAPRRTHDHDHDHDVDQDADRLDVDRPHDADRHDVDRPHDHAGDRPHGRTVRVAHSDGDGVPDTARPAPVDVVHVQREPLQPVRSDTDGVGVARSDGGRTEPGGLLGGAPVDGPSAQDERPRR